MIYYTKEIPYKPIGISIQWHEIIISHKCCFSIMNKEERGLKVRTPDILELLISITPP